MIMGGFGWEIIFFLLEMVVMGCATIAIPISYFFGRSKETVKFFFVLYGLSCIGNIGMLARGWHFFKHGVRGDELLFDLYMLRGSFLFIFSIIEIFGIHSGREIFSKYYLFILFFFAWVPWFLVLVVPRII